MLLVGAEMYGDRAGDFVLLLSYCLHNHLCVNQHRRHIELIIAIIMPKD